MEDGILKTIKSMLGIGDDPFSNAFDNELVFWINSSFATLYQLGFEPAKGFRITGLQDTWDDLKVEDSNLLDMVIQYIYLKVRLGFDPPSTSFVLDALNNQLKEFEWRIYVQSEGGLINAT